MWKSVIGFEGLYEVSDDGQVRSFPRPGTPGGVLKQTLSGPYLMVSLWKDGRRTPRRVHNLVAEAFLKPCPAGQEVRHGPNGQQDNSVGNLSYGTHQVNIMDKVRDGTDNRGERNPGARLNRQMIQEAARLRAIGLTYREISERTGVSRQSISEALRGVTWSHK